MANFLTASSFTMDKTLQKTLKECSQGLYPPHFSVSNGVIITVKGNKYPIPLDPMDLCNLVHTIISGKERGPNNIIGPSTRVPFIRNSGTSDDAINTFAASQASKLGRDKKYERLLYSCIFTGIHFGYIKPTDITQDSKGNILTIRNVDINTPELLLQ